MPVKGYRGLLGALLLGLLKAAACWLGVVVERVPVKGYRGLLGELLSWLESLL